MQRCQNLNINNRGNFLNSNFASRILLELGYVLLALIYFFRTSVAEELIQKGRVPNLINLFGFKLHLDRETRSLGERTGLISN